LTADQGSPHWAHAGQSADRFQCRKAVAQRRRSADAAGGRIQQPVNHHCSLPSSFIHSGKASFSA
jgi:hypothetical protein